MDAILQILDKAYTDVVSGNVYAIILFSILCFAIMWKTSENSVRSFVSFIKHLFVKEKAHEHSLFIMSLIRAEIITAGDIKYSNDTGRHLLYRFIVTTFFTSMQKRITDLYDNYFSGKISPASFCDMDKHKQLLIEAREEANEIIRQKLTHEGWSQEKISFLINTVHFWMAGHCRLFNKYILASTSPRTYLQNWLWICGEIVTEGEQLDIQFDGEIAGQTFEGVTLYEPDQK